MYHLYTDMPLIEGVGDEVTIVFSIVFLCLILCIAWLSTNIQALPFYGVIVIELTRGRNRNQEQRNNIESSESSTASSTSGEESTGEQSTQEEPENITSSLSKDNGNDQTVGADSHVSVNESDDVNTANNSIENPNIETTVTQELTTEHSQETPANAPIRNSDDDLPATETELRRRRVAFFSGNTSSSDSVNENNTQRSEARVCTESLSNINSDKSKDKDRSKTSEKNNDENCSQHESNDSGISSESGQTDKVRIRLKYLNETQRNVEASLDDTIDQFRRTHFSEELAANKLVRFIFNGQDLRNDQNTLQAYNIVDNSVIHCLITQVNRQTTPARDGDGEGFDVGMLMLPCFGLLLCFMWYLRFEHKQFFSGTSTVCLIGMSLLYIAALLALWENRRRGHNHIHVD